LYGSMETFIRRGEGSWEGKTSRQIRWPRQFFLIVQIFDSDKSVTGKDLGIKTDYHQLTTKKASFNFTDHDTQMAQGQWLCRLHNHISY
jgi:hypothetical protein